METMTLHSVKFKRTKNSKWENGLAINTDQVIVTPRGEILKKTPWTIMNAHYHFNVQLYFPEGKPL